MIARRIRLLREEKQVTQQWIAKALNVKRETINQWENGTRDIKAKHIIALAEYFNVSSDYLLGLTDVRVYPQDEKDKMIEKLTWKVADYEYRIHCANKALNS